MRPISFLLVAAFVGAFAPLSVQAQDVNVSLASRYIDMNTFNDVFSDAPALQIDGSYDLNSHLYVSAYVYTGFSKPLVDDSSEYGFEVGGKWELSQKATLNLSTGRYADYQGQGFGAGDGNDVRTRKRFGVSPTRSDQYATDQQLLRAASHEPPHGYAEHCVLHRAEQTESRIFGELSIY
jgi:hypothetical protein